MMSLTTDKKQEVLEAAISGLSRVAEAILATPNEARIKALDAAADSYRQTAQVLGYDEAELQEWVAIMFRLRGEVTRQELAQQRHQLACTRFQRHGVKCFYGTGGESWRDEGLRGSSSLKLCG
jgi:hypothetical protein